MPRAARIRSQSGIYHVMLRGLDKRDIFLEDRDRQRFLVGMFRAKEKAEFELYGYCLMDNHVHILLRESEEEVGNIVKRITVGYIGWHNRKYERTGHLFQNRFLSEPVETEGYLLTVLRYIHQNPVKAGLTQKPKDYPWSSFGDYDNIYKGKETIIDGDMVRGYLTKYKDFEKFMDTQVEREDDILKYRPVISNSDERIRSLIKTKYSVNNLDSLSKEERFTLIGDIYRNEKTSIRQLGRVFGVGKTLVERSIKKDR